MRYKVVGMIYNPLQVTDAAGNRVTGYSPMQRGEDSSYVTLREKVVGPQQAAATPQERLVKAMHTVSQMIKFSSLSKRMAESENPVRFKDDSTMVSDSLLQEMRQRLGNEEF